VAASAAVGYGRPVPKTLIVSRDTICSLLEAHASMAAWYYQLYNALRAAGAGAEPPDERLRLAFLQQIGTHFPDLGEVARSIDHPRPYIPPPAFVPSAGEGPEPAAGDAEPPAVPDAAPTESASTPPPGAVPPPPIVDPKKVRYE